MHRGFSFRGLWFAAKFIQIADEHVLRTQEARMTDVAVRNRFTGGAGYAPLTAQTIGTFLESNPQVKRARWKISRLVRARSGRRQSQSRLHRQRTNRRRVREA